MVSKNINEYKLFFLTRDRTSAGSAQTHSMHVRRNSGSLSTVHCQKLLAFIELFVVLFTSFCADTRLTTSKFYLLTVTHGQYISDSETTDRDSSQQIFYSQSLGNFILKKIRLSKTVDKKNVIAKLVGI